MSGFPEINDNKRKGEQGIRFHPDLHDDFHREVSYLRLSHLGSSRGKRVGTLIRISNESIISGPFFDFA